MMDNVFGIITVGSASMLLMEGIKWLITKIGWKPDMGFSSAFYLIGLPVLNALVPFPLVWLGLNITSPTLEMTWIEVIKYLVLTVLGALTSLVVYRDGVKPLKDKASEQKILKELA